MRTTPAQGSFFARETSIRTCESADVAVVPADPSQDMAFPSRYPEERAVLGWTRLRLGSHLRSTLMARNRPMDYCHHVPGIRHSITNFELDFSAPIADLRLVQPNCADARAPTRPHSCAEHAHNYEHQRIRAIAKDQDKLSVCNAPGPGAATG
jgi:hypothetical protein